MISKFGVLEQNVIYFVSKLELIHKKKTNLWAKNYFWLRLDDSNFNDDENCRLQLILQILYVPQDHVAATFGAGLGYACVIDVGDQKTSVSCVEDGISHRNTRVRMDYGGGDITQTFYWLLQKCAFPYKNCEPSNRLDALLLSQMKQDFCHVDLNVCGSQEKTFVVKKPKQPIEKYTLQVMLFILFRDKQINN